MISNRFVRGAMLVMIFSLFFGLALVRPAPAYGCSCVMPGAPHAEMARSGAVFAGKVIAIHGPSRHLVFTPSVPFLKFVSRRGSTQMIFAVSQVWKGPAHPRILVETGPTGGACGYEFEQWQEYIVYAYNTPTGLATDICTRTQPLSAAQEDLMALGPGIPPMADEPPSPAAGLTWPVAVIVGIALALIGAGAVAKVRHS